jgi:Protein of unknown function (DUF3179)
VHWPNLTPSGSTRSNAAWLALAAVLALEAAGIAAIFSAERRAQQADESRISAFQKAGPGWRKALVDGDTGLDPHNHRRKPGPARGERLVAPISRPPSVAANEANLHPDELVIGVEVGGKAQAYQFKGFERKSGHLVNDMVGAVPVSVAYCDLTECLRVYSDPRAAQPLDLTVAGVLNGEMILRHGGKMYFHRSGSEVDPGLEPSTLPFQMITPTVMKWKEWSARHPDTRVYVGKRDDASQKRQRTSVGAAQ